MQEPTTVWDRPVTNSQLSQFWGHEAGNNIARDRMALAFIKACANGDANALANFAPTVRDWNAPNNKPVTDIANMSRRYQTVAEVMQEGLEYASGPSMTEAMQLILNVAYGSDTVNAPEQARALISRMAESFAKYNHQEG